MEEYYQQTFASPLPAGEAVDRDAPGAGRDYWESAMHVPEGREALWFPPAKRNYVRPPYVPTPAPGRQLCFEEMRELLDMQTQRELEAAAARQEPAPPPRRVRNPLEPVKIVPKAQRKERP